METRGGEKIALLKIDEFLKSHSLKDEINFSKFLKYFYSLDLTGNCKTVAKITKCTNCESHYIKTTMSCHEYFMCPTCSSNYANERVHYVYEHILRPMNFFSKKKLKLICMEFTLPEELYSLIDFDIKKVKSIKLDDWGIPYTINEKITDYSGVKFFRTMVHEFIKQFFGDVGFITAFHWWHSENPFGDFYPHLHVILPNIVRKSDKKSFEFFKPFFGSKKISDFYKKIDRSWNSYLNNVFSHEFSNLNGVEYKYIKYNETGKLINRLSYMFRTPNKDIIKFIDKNGFPIFNREQVYSRLLRNPAEHFKRIINVGWLSDSVKNDNLKLLCNDLLKDFTFKGTRIAKNLKESENICVNCGAVNSFHSNNYWTSLRKLCEKIIQGSYDFG